MFVNSNNGLYLDNQEEPKNQGCYHLVSLITLFMILIIETYYSQSLFDSSLDFIVKI